MKIAFKISANKLQKPTRSIYTGVIYDRLHQNKINTEIEVLPDQWDAARQKVVNHPAAKVKWLHYLYDFYGERPFDRQD
ncbi:MAG: hypothetical protein K2O66_04590 [Bacteroidales bacterium]|nr:hypothetical protein [Bacteroidales bacterium]MDE7072620.1 hypothetical protein [Bacteroidales bacterium]